MHEQSETIQDPTTGKWINVYGRGVKDKAGQRLPDSDTYDTVEQATQAARARSRAAPEPKFRLMPQGKRRRLGFNTDEP